MNKATKGAVAAGAAGILLLGGAGTFALWEDNASITGGTVSTGHLDLAVAAGTWAQTASPGTPINISTFDIVPGDSLTYTTTVTATATGDNLKGELKLEGSTFVAAFNALPPEHVTATVTHTAVDGGGLLVDDLDPNLMTFVDSATPYTFDVKITVAFSSAADELDDQDLAILLPALALTLEQTT
jgi:alternate signal-mediated exported protein